MITREQQDVLDNLAETYDSVEVHPTRGRVGPVTVHCHNRVEPTPGSADTSPHRGTRCVRSMVIGANGREKR